MLKQNHNIDAETISPFNDKFRHVDLLIKTKNGSRYIVDPLTDLIEMQVGLRTNNFASENYYNNMYNGILEDISFLSDEELEEIDDEIGYKNNGFYLDDVFKLLRTKFENMGKTDLKIKFISKHLNNRKNLNGFVELWILSNIVIKNLFTEKEQEKIHVNSFFVDELDLKNNDIRNILTDKENRKRGIVISSNGKNYIFTLNPNSLEFDDAEWKI